ncbi:DUF1992 domain-containing protein [Nocardia sp. 2]|uniref:DUF1992 domain-containing protein n=1 Tax=Nocardia acididurans TaxID=2802282 RepID=A0ABS1M1L4_9NOCA|nr:DUF1992 domain-containing protein [Nocardia acididurans]MBL1074548.1 DUF1992 domain-containing protein [Nocardia acididurans]
MTERKPPGHTFESWIDKQIREATERGEFDDLPGKGEPLPGAGAPLDENWWLNSYLRREGIGGEALLPPSIVLRRDAERIQQTVRDLAAEAQVRAVVGELNDRVVQYLRMPTPPHVPVRPVNADDVVAQWRSERAAARAAQAVPRPPAKTAATSAEPSNRRRKWLRALFSGKRA